MFGGVGFLLNGNMLVGVWKDSVIVLLGPDNHDDALLKTHVREFDITGKPMSWVLVEPAGVKEDEQLAGWIERALTFVKAFRPGRRLGVDAAAVLLRLRLEHPAGRAGLLQLQLCRPRRVW